MIDRIKELIDFDLDEAVIDDESAMTSFTMASAVGNWSFMYYYQWIELISIELNV